MYRLLQQRSVCLQYLPVSEHQWHRVNDVFTRFFVAHPSQVELDEQNERKKMEELQENRMEEDESEVKERKLKDQYFRREQEEDTGEILIDYVKRMLEYRMRKGMLPVINGVTFVFKKDPKGEIEKGEIVMYVKNLSEKPINEVILISPYVEKKMIKKFTVKHIDMRDDTYLDNVIYYSSHDTNYFDRVKEK